MVKDTVKITNKCNTLMIAHRGLSGIETENTAAAFIAAGNRSYYGVETDIYRTSDGYYICNHDGNSNRIANTNLNMEGSTLEALTSIRMNSREGKECGYLRLCTPEEYRDICERYGKVCVPELKSNFTIEEIREIINIFDGYLDSTCFISFNMNNLKLVKEVCPEQRCQFLTDHYSDELANELAVNKMGLDIYYGSINEENVKYLHNLGVEVNTWTVDKAEDAEKLIAFGVDMITTNILE